MNIKKIIQEKQKEFPNLQINQIRVVLALEGIISRLSKNKTLSKHLVFKGGFVLLKKYASPRFTRDLDASAIKISKSKIHTLVENALGKDLQDGLWFGDLQSFELGFEQEYGGYRFDCAFQIGSPDIKKIHKLSRVHLDISFDDQISLVPHEEKINIFLKNITSWRVYTIEFIVAEKLETLIRRGSGNSRAKDIFDLIYLIPKCEDETKLKEALKVTFTNRRTELPKSFSENVARIDTSILAKSWLSTGLNEQSFDQAWKKLITQTKRLDFL